MPTAPKSRPNPYKAQKPKNESWGQDTDFYRHAPWIRLRNAHRLANPLCVDCLAEGRAVSILNNKGVVDHVLPRDTHPHLELDPTNLASRCHRHHNSKTAKEQKQPLV